jgi:hypothetical protein
MPPTFFLNGALKVVLKQIAWSVRWSCTSIDP